MILNNIKIVTRDAVIENGYIEMKDGVIADVRSGSYVGDDEVINGQGKIAFPGFIDIHTHGSCGIDFMDADENGIKTIADAFYKEGITTFLATTLTSDFESLDRVCKVVANAKKDVPSLGGIHLEGPYINEKYKGAQNAAYIRNPNIEEFNTLVKDSNGNIRDISLAPEKEGALEFIKNAVKQNVVCSVGHSDATFKDVEKAIEMGLTNVTHTHNAQSGHHHRNPGVVSAAMYFDELYTEVICDCIHVSEDALKAFYKVVGPNRFIIITDSLKVKHAQFDEFQLFGLDCIRRDGAAYLKSGPLAGSILNYDQGIRNVRRITGASLIDLAKVSSYNAAKSIGFKDRGELAVGKIADVVLMDEDLNVKEVYKLGKRVF